VGGGLVVKGIRLGVGGLGPGVWGLGLGIWGSILGANTKFGYSGIVPAQYHPESRMPNPESLTYAPGTKLPYSV